MERGANPELEPEHRRAMDSGSLMDESQTTRREAASLCKGRPHHLAGYHFLKPFILNPYGRCFQVGQQLPFHYKFTAIVPAAASQSGLEYLELGSRSHGAGERDAASCGIEQGSRLS